LVCQRSRIANIRSVIGTFDPRSPLRAILATSREETISASIAGDAEDAKGSVGRAPFGTSGSAPRSRGYVDNLPTRKSGLQLTARWRVYGFDGRRFSTAVLGSTARIADRVGSQGHLGWEQVQPAGGGSTTAAFRLLFPLASPKI
jgi:hypothetical protein